MKTIGICYLGQHVKTGDFVLLQFARDHLAFVMIGPAVLIPQQKIEVEGLAMVLSYLRNTAKVDSKIISESQKIPKEEFLKLKRNHLLVELALLHDTSEIMKVIPLHGKHGLRFDMNEDEIRKVPLPRTNEEFISNLREALEIAS